MKIAMLMDARNPVFGGGTTNIKFLSTLLVQNHKCNVDVFVRKLKDQEGKTYTNDEQKFGGKWRLFRIGPTASFFNVMSRIINLIVITLYVLYMTIKEKYDIIHAHAYVYGLPAKIVGFLTKTPIVYTVNGTMGLDAKRKGILASIERRLVCEIKYNKEISVSHKIFEYPNVNKNIHIIYNGVDLQQYDAIKTAEKYSGACFIYVGRFDWQKGIEYLIKAVHLIDKNLLDKKGFVVNMVGDGELKETYEKLITHYHLEKYFVFKGKLFGGELIKEYKKNQIFILPSLAEGQPLTLLEAFASKLPVLVTDVGDNKYFVKEGENGWMVPAGDEEALAESIEKVLKTDPISLEEIGERNYSLVQKYSWKNIVKQTYHQYTLLITM